MSKVFGPAYTAAYDELYRNKEYASECDLLERVFARYATEPVQRILDLGCGTGSHAVILAQRGYEVVGIDCSAEMLNRARRKATELAVGSRLTLVQDDIAAASVEPLCDAVVMFFAVLGYQTAPGAVSAALRAARRNVCRGALLVSDVWYGPAVLKQRPAQRWRISGDSSERMLRFATGELDERQQVCSVSLHLWQLSGDRLTAEVEERHLVRYFFQAEIAAVLQEGGFALLRLGAFPELDVNPDETTWNVTIVARAV